MPRAILSLLSCCSILTSLAVPAVQAETIDPEDDGSQYAWGENLGWANAEPLGDGGTGVRVLEDRLDGWIWLENGGWISLSCHNTGSCAEVSFGVLNDGAGVLAGWAWAENLGWLSLSCENTATCATVDYGVIIDPASGDFTGWAWSENAGWLSLSCENTATCATVDYLTRTETPFLTVGIFSDGFESGDTSAWSSSEP